MSDPRQRRGLDGVAVSLTEQVIRFRWPIIVLSIVIAVLVASNARFLTFGNNYRVFFSDENPELVAFENLQDTYTKNDNFFFLIRRKDGGDVFEPETMTAVAELTEAGWQLPFSTRVDSVSNFQHTYAIEDDLIVENLIPDPTALDTNGWDKKRATALAEPLIVNQLIAEHGRATAVNVTLQYPETSPTEMDEAVAAARALRAQIRETYPQLDVHLSGVSMLSNAFVESGKGDFSSLVPSMFLLVLVLTLVTLRSIGATLSTMLVIVLSIMIAIGAGGIFRVPLTPISLSSMIVILTLAVADSVHVLLTMRGNMQRGMAKREALIDAIRINFLAVAITSLTTIVGFLALNFSDAPPFKHLGNMSALGIFAAWAYSITLLPALISLVPMRVQAQSQQTGGAALMARFGAFVVRHHRNLAIGSIVVAVIVVAQIPRIQFNDEWTKYFSTAIEFRQETDKVTEEFGLYTIEFSVPAGEPGGISNPDYLQRLEAFTDHLKANPLATHVFSLSDIMKRLNRNLNGDDPAFYRLPEERELSAQYLLLYELSLPYGLDLNDRINIDKSATRVTMTLGNVTTTETKGILADVEAYIAEHFPEGQRATPTSAQVMFTYITDRNIAQMIRGTIIAIVAISIIMIVALRSVRLGVLSLIPNGLPILFAFGMWAILIGEVGFSIAVVAAISLGIVVDDTVHLMTKYLRGRRERGLAPREAIVYSFSNVGLAIFVNTVILSVGFSLLMMSTFKVTQDMGLLTVLSITFAMVFDFLFLPALLIWTDKLTTQTSAASQKGHVA